MPYNSVQDLPEQVRGSLPEHAQEIYVAAFNNSLEEYKDEKTAHKVAWSAVKDKYEKANGSWKKRS